MHVLQSADAVQGHWRRAYIRLTSLLLVQLHLGSLKDEHLHFIRGDREGVVQSLEEPHLHNAYFTDGVTEGFCNAGVGDRRSVIPELH